MFRENNIDYDKVNYFIEPLGEEKLRALLKKAGLKPFDVVRKGEAAFRELKLSPETPDDEVLRALVEHPSLLQRPIVETDAGAVLARPVDKALELLKKSL